MAWSRTQRERMLSASVLALSYCLSVTTHGQLQAPKEAGDRARKKAERQEWRAQQKSARKSHKEQRQKEKIERIKAIRERMENWRTEDPQKWTKREFRQNLREELAPESDYERFNEPDFGFRGPMDAPPKDVNKGNCKEEEGKATVFLPPESERDTIGDNYRIVFPGSNEVDCRAKGRGSGGDSSKRKGNTPTGQYKGDYIGGNSKGKWGGKGLHIKQEKIDKGRSSGSLFIHSRNGLQTGDQMANMKTWGCVLIPQPCMAKLRDYFKGLRKPLDVSVVEGECTQAESTGSGGAATQ